MTSCHDRHWFCSFWVHSRICRHVKSKWGLVRISDQLELIFVLLSFSNDESFKFQKFVLKVLRRFLWNCCSPANQQVMSVHELVMTPVYWSFKCTLSNVSGFCHRFCFQTNNCGGNSNTSLSLLVNPFLQFFLQFRKFGWAIAWHSLLATKTFQFFLLWSPPSNILLINLELVRCLSISFL